MSTVPTNTSTKAIKIDLLAGRRAFLKSAGLLAAGAATIGIVGGTPDVAHAALTDTQILNFALNLEYLEAEFYLIAATGKGLKNSDTTGTGALGEVKGGKKVKFKSDLIKEYAQEIANDEEAHVKFLRTALGASAVARPTINLNTSFTAAARAAGLIKNNQKFDAFDNEDNFLLAAFIFEDVGVTAYKGAAAMITDPGILEAAAGLLAVEAYHAGEIRTLLASKGFFAQANAISDARDSLDGGTDLDQGIRKNRNVNIVPTDANGLAFSRTPEQVLQVVYLGDAPSNASFFPDGVNSGA
ncbi:MAG: ferritin-like domain-containing protein [Rhizobium sp.]|nr:ferritin-like domain-containing protein [Rhizobium sp.]